MNPIKLLHPNQVWDEGRGSFFVGLTASKERYKGQVVHIDKFGQRVVIVEREEAA